MNPNALRYFLEVAEAGSFRRAGDSLRIAASAVNRQVSLLEADLGAALFERGRGRNRLRLTAAGEILARYARTALNEVERARYEIEALQGLRAGNIILGAPETLGREFLPTFLAGFHAAYPRISFRIVADVSPRLIEMLLEDEIEIAFVHLPNLPPAAEVVAQIDRKRYLMTRADHPLAKRSTVRLSDLADVPMVMPDHGTSTRAFYDRIFAKLRVRPRSIVTATSYEMLRSAARVGLGVSIVDKYLMPVQDNADPDVVFIPFRDPIVRPQRLACCVRRGRTLSVASRALIERVKQEFRRLRRKA